MKELNQSYNPDAKITPEDLGQEMKSKLIEAYKRDLSGTSDRLLAYIKLIREKYSDYEDYRYYHSLVGSSPTEERIKANDFPSPDSVIEFIETLKA